jgi:hypothetical protein
MGMKLSEITPVFIGGLDAILLLPVNLDGASLPGKDRNVARDSVLMRVELH